MIVFNQISFIALGANEQTHKKAKQAIVKFQTPCKGKISSWVTFEDENGIGVVNGLHKEYLQADFISKDILATLHTSYKLELEILNPLLTITIE